MFHVKQLRNKCNFYTNKLKTAFICVLSEFFIFKRISLPQKQFNALKTALKCLIWYYLFLVIYAHTRNVPYKRIYFAYKRI